MLPTLIDHGETCSLHFSPLFAGCCYSNASLSVLLPAVTQHHGPVFVNAPDVPVMGHPCDQCRVLSPLVRSVTTTFVTLAFARQSP